MNDSDEVQILQDKVEKLEQELQVSTDALHLARQQLQLQDKLIEDVDKLRKEVELANKRLEERDVQLQCLLRQLALTQTKCNELEEERNRKSNLDILQKNPGAGEINLETCQEENEKLREALKETKEKVGTSNAKQKSMRKEIDQLTKELYDYRNENKQRHYGCDKSTQTQHLTDYSNGNKRKETEEEVYDLHASEEQFPDWSMEKFCGQHSLSIADSIKGVAEKMVQELDLDKEKGLNGENAGQVGSYPDSSLQGQDEGSGDGNTSHAPDSSFVFDPSSGMYYDSRSGYYYDSSSTLYYDPRTGTYFYYNHSTQEYEFHSKVDLSEYNGEAGQDSASDSCASSTDSDEESQTESSELEEGEIKEEKSPKKKSHKNKKKYQTVENGSAVSYLVPCEDDPYNSKSISAEPVLYRGDHVDAESSDVTNGTDYQACMELYAQISPQKDSLTRNVSHQRQESSEMWPPCIRLIVTESNCLDVGKLFVVTCTGASIGQRKKDLIQVNDIGKVGLFAKISFDKKKQCYTVKGYSKHTAPCVNDKQVFQGHEPVSLAHEDCLIVGQTKLSVHIHDGYDTCDGCEPGLVQAKYAAEIESKQPECMSASHEETKKKKHRKELMEIKKKYGLKDSAYVDNKEVLKNPNYVDKASNRRKTVGSDNPYKKTQTEQTSVHEEISTENRGRKMLEKLGWSSGQSLGKTSCGIVEPITPFVRLDPAAGLGSCATSMTLISQKEKNWFNAKARFDKIDKRDVSEVKPSKRYKMWIKGQTLNPS